MAHPNVYCDRNGSDGTIDNEVHSVLFGDVIEDVANVSIDNVQIDWLADESRLSILFALIQLVCRSNATYQLAEWAIGAGAIAVCFDCCTRGFGYWCSYRRRLMSLGVAEALMTV